MSFAKSEGGRGGQPPGRAGHWQVPATAGASQVTRQLQASAGTVECVLVSKCGWRFPRGRQGFLSSLVPVG